MKLNEAEMRMAYQIESTDPNAVLNEIYMTWRLSRNQATRDTAESLMAKLRSLSNSECMDLIREVQANYRLPGKPQTIGEMLAEARQKSGAQKLAGHDIMAVSYTHLDVYKRQEEEVVASNTGRTALKEVSPQVKL